MPEPKKGGLLLAIMGKKPKDSEESSPDMHDSGLADSAGELADILGVPEEKRDAFASALKGYVHQCMASDEDEGAEDEEGGEY